MEDRDLPSLQPPYHELTAIADGIVGKVRAATRHELIWLRHGIVSALMEVRRKASEHAADKAREYYER